MAGDKDPEVKEEELISEDEDDGEDIEFSEGEEEEDEEDESGTNQMLLGVIHNALHLPVEDEEEEVGANIVEVLEASMDRIGKGIETQNKILLKILTQLSK